MPKRPITSKIFHQRLPLVLVAELAATAQFGHKEIDDAEQVARRRDRVCEHEAATASGCLEHLFHVVGDLCGGARDSPVVGRCAFEFVLKKFLARDLGSAPMSFAS